jgi:hypothetical protein
MDGLGRCGWWRDGWDGGMVEWGMGNGEWGMCQWVLGGACDAGLMLVTVHREGGYLMVFEL